MNEQEFEEFPDACMRRRENSVVFLVSSLKYDGAMKSYGHKCQYWLVLSIILGDDSHHIEKHKGYIKPHQLKLMQMY